MSLETITITRQVPIINGFVVLPNNLSSKPTSVSVADFVRTTGGVVNRLSQDSGMGENGGRFGPQEWVELSEPVACCDYDAVMEAGKTAYQTNQRTDPLMPWE